MLRTTTVTQLRSELSSHLKDLSEGPVLVLSRSRPAAVLLEPEMFESLVEKIELLEDLVEGRRAIDEYLRDKTAAVEAEEVFEHLGH